ncbi:unnamed protein product, partial [marine sediment metagenome]
MSYLYKGWCKVNTHLDYLRLASWDTGAYTKILARLMRAWEGDWEHSGWLQYDGWAKDGLFIGHGTQAKKSHTILNISGALAQKMLPTLRDLLGWYCTRIDLQITVEACVMRDDRLAYIRDDTSTENTTLIESKENDTLYVGSRTAEKFTRLYEKFLDNDKFLRLEFELKGQQSRAAWEAITAGEPVDKIFKYHLKRSKLPPRVIEWFNAYGIT